MLLDDSPYPSKGKNDKQKILLLNLEGSVKSGVTS